VLLLFVPTARWGALLALLLLLVFIGGVANAMRKGLDVDCGCFGKVYSATAGSATLVRNGILAALALVVLVHGSGPAINDWIAARSGAEVAAIVASVAALILAGVVWWLWSRNRTLRRDLELFRSTQAPASGAPRSGIPTATRWARWPPRSSSPIWTGARTRSSRCSHLDVRWWSRSWRSAAGHARRSGPMLRAGALRLRIA
jgi:hypothetical protein